MPSAGDPYLQGLALPLSHNPLQRMSYTSQMPYLSNEAITEAEQKAIASFLQILDQQTGIDLTDWWANTVTVQNANQAFSQAIQTAIQNYTDWNTFITACETAWNIWIVTVTNLDHADTPSLNSLLSSLFGMNTATGGNVGAETAQTWATRLTNDLLILLDVFHLSHTATQWNNAWTDLLSLFGIVNSTTTPTDPTPTIGPAISAAQATANTGVSNAATAQTTANSGNTNTGTFLAYTRILADVFHLTYEPGLSSDTPTTLGSNGKPTWYSAWNGLLQLEGLVKASTAPTDTAPTTGAVIQANTAAANTAASNASLASAANQDLMNQVIGSQTGATPTAGTSTDVYNALQNIPASNIQGQTGAQVLWGATGGGGAGMSSTSWSHTPAATDTSIDIVWSYTSGSATSASPTVTVSGGLTAVKVNGFTTTSVLGGYFTSEVWRVSLTPTPSPTSKTITVAINDSAGGNRYASGNSLSYSGIKVNYSNTYAGSMSAGTNTITMSRTSAADKRLIMYVGLWGSSAVSSWSGATGVTSRSTRTAMNTGPANFMGDTQGTGTTNQTMSVNCVLPAGGSATWIGLLIEMSN